MKARWHLSLTLGLFFLAVVGGAFAYHFVEGWGFLDSLYFVVITVTTIGYGDLVPQTVEGKMFTMFFAFFGVATALYVFSTVSSAIFKKHVGKKVSQIKKGVRAEEKIKEQVKDTIRKAVRKK